MRTRTTIWLTALGAVLVGAAAIAASGQPPAATAGGAAHVHSGHALSGHPTKHGGNLQERFLYVSTIAQSKTDPDFIAVIGADPRHADFGKIVNRVDMPNVGD